MRNYTLQFILPRFYVRSEMGDGRWEMGVETCFSLRIWGRGAPDLLRLPLLVDFLSKIIFSSQ